MKRLSIAALLLASATICARLLDAGQTATPVPAPSAAQSVPTEGNGATPAGSDLDPLSPRDDATSPGPVATAPTDPRFLGEDAQSPSLPNSVLSDPAAGSIPNSGKITFFDPSQLEAATKSNADDPAGSFGVADQATPLVLYSTTMTDADVKKLQERFSNEAQIVVQRDATGKPNRILVKAQPSVHAKLNAIVGFLNPTAVTKREMIPETSQQATSAFAPRTPQRAFYDYWAVQSPTYDRLRPQFDYAITPGQQIRGYPTATSQPAQLQVFPEPIARAMQQVQAAKTDEERRQAKSYLRAVLVEVFAEDMQLRNVQAKEIEERLATLKTQYEARQNARDQIIDLQMKVLEQEAAGLGFPGPQSRSSQQGKWTQPQRQSSLSTPTKLRGQPGANNPVDTQLQANDFSSAITNAAQALGAFNADADRRNVEAARRLHEKANVGAVSPDQLDLLARLRKATAAVAEHQAAWDQRVKEAKTTDVPISIEELQKRHPAEWKSLETARSELLAEQSLLDATVKLLELQRQRVEVGIHSAKAKLAVMTELQAKGVKSDRELEVQKAELRAAEIEREQVNKIIETLREVSPPIKR